MYNLPLTSITFQNVVINPSSSFTLDATIKGGLIHSNNNLNITILDLNTNVSFDFVSSNIFILPKGKMRIRITNNGSENINLTYYI